MRRWWAIAVAALAAAGAAWAADEALSGGSPYGLGADGPQGFDRKTLELSWDNGDREWSIAWYTGAGAWVGNDFSVSTLKTRHVKILRFKTYTRSDWPNAVWDGFRIGVFDFAGNVPGSRLWPTSGEGRFFKPGLASDEGWVTCAVDWVCPAVKFVAAQQQYYNWPACDPFSVDSNPTFRRHSWEYYGGRWAFLSTIGDPFRNAMIRLRVETWYMLPGVAPSSLGRVKALYY